MFSAGPGDFRGGYEYGGFNVDFGAPSDYGLAAGGGFLASQGDGGDPNPEIRRSNDGQAIHPLTISMVQRSCLEFSQEQRLKTLGEDVIMFKLVGMIQDLRIDDASEKWCFKLDDSTGIINVEWLSNLEREYTEMGPSPWKKEQLSKMQEFSYVRIFGDVNTLGKSIPHVTAFHVSAVEFPLEIFDHMAQVLKFIVRKKFPNPILADVQRRSSTEAIPSMQIRTQEKHPASINSQQQQVDSMTPLSFGNLTAPNSLLFYNASPTKENQTSITILEILKNMANLKPNGLSEDEILAQLWGRGIGIQETDVNKECRSLLSRGIIHNNGQGKWKLSGF